MRQHRMAGVSAFWLTAALLPAGCNEAPSTAQPQPTTIVEEKAQSPGAEEEQQPPVVADPAETGKFDLFFPKPEDGYEIVFQPENPGYAQASLHGEGDKELAVFSIFDTEKSPIVLARFERSEQKIGEHTVLSEESSLSALIAERYHVQVRSVAPNFGEAERQTWLEKFDLAGIAKME
jgi:hypothetical protein